MQKPADFFSCQSGHPHDGAQQLLGAMLNFVPDPSVKTALAAFIEVFQASLEPPKPVPAAAAPVENKAAEAEQAQVAAAQEPRRNLVVIQTPEKFVSLETCQLLMLTALVRDKVDTARLASNLLPLARSFVQFLETFTPTAKDVWNPESQAAVVEELAKLRV